MRNDEYNLCKSLSVYLRLQYPKVLFHYDLSGLNHSPAQAGMTKMIQGGRGWPDLFLAEPRGIYKGLFLELKAEGTNIFKRDGETFATPHIAEQSTMIDALSRRGYASSFAIGFDEAKQLIDAYLNYGEMQKQYTHYEHTSIRR